MTYLHITKGSGKMKGLDSLNTDNTIIDFCKKMYHSKKLSYVQIVTPGVCCYDEKLYTQI